MPFRIFSPASATWRRSASVPITKAVRPERVSASRCCTAPPTVTTSRHGRPDADLPQPGHVVLGGAARVVGRVGDVLAGVAQRLDRLHGARCGLVADPDAAVEIEDELVVRRGEGGQGHVASLRRHAQAAFSAALRARPRARRVRGRRRRAARGRRRRRPRRPPSEQQAGCKDVEQPAPRDDGGEKPPAAPLDTGEDLRRRAHHELRRLHDPARPEDLAEGGGLVRSARAQRLLRRHDLPPHRARLRDPGRRPHRRAARAAPDTRRGTAFRRCGLCPRRGRHGEGGQRAGRARRAASSSWSRAPTPACTPDYALLGKVTKGMDVVQAIGELGDPASGGAGTPLQSVVIEGAKVSER